jgi:hypothetical protein
MTTFSDRELAIEAHYAALELTVFREHFDAARTVGQHIASRLGMTDTKAGRFAVEFAERYVVERADMSAYDGMIAEILALKTGEPERRAGAGPDMNSPTPYADRPWVEFVMGQMLLLFGADGTGPAATAERPH